MFHDASSRIPNNSPAFHYGIAVADLEGDGHFQIIVTGYNGPNRILQHQDGRFEEWTNEILADSQRQAIGLAAGDFDGDGAEELYVLNTDQFAGLKLFSDRLFDFDGQQWRDLFIAAGDSELLNMTAGRSVCAIDRMGMGRYGFFVANYGGPMRLYELNDDGHIVDVAPEANVDLTTGGRSLLSFPLLSPHMDLICGNEGGFNALFRNQGDGTFEELSEEYGFDDPHENARGMAPIWLDDAFGIVLGNWEGEHRLYRLLERDEIFEDVGSGNFGQPSRVRTVIVADFDNDGYEEIFLNNIGEPNQLFGLRDGIWKKLPLGDAEEPGGLGTGAVFGDFDHDGRLELMIAHGELAPQPLSYYVTEPNENHFLRVLPRTTSGAPARGAIVTVRAGQRVWRRAVDAGSGYLCQMEPVAHFGLGLCDRVDEIAIQFPSGRTITFAHEQVDCLVEAADPGSDE